MAKLNSFLKKPKQKLHPVGKNVTLNVIFIEYFTKLLPFGYL